MPFLLIAVLGASLGTATSPVFYIPVVSAPARPIPISTNSSVASSWASDLEAINPNASPASLVPVHLYGPAGDVSCLPVTSTILAPRTGGQLSGYLDLLNCVAQGANVAFLELAVDPGVDVSARIYRLGVTCSRVEAYASARIPAYRSLFPANSTATSEDINASESVLCAQSATGEKRLNLTLFNASQELAHFRVVLVYRANLPPTNAEYSLEPFQVIQVNGLPASGATHWLTVSSDQPYLCYASATLESSRNEPPYVTTEAFAFRVNAQ